MATLPIYDRAGAEVGKYEVDPDAIAPSISKQLLHDAVVMYQANQRQGSAKTKSRGEVAGSRQKLYRQKGTGRARAGGKRSGTRRGGGHIKSKQPRDYSYRLPRKALQAATRMAIAGKLADAEFVVLDELSLAEIKTKPVADTLQALGIAGQSTLLAVEKHDPVIHLSARNIAGLSVMPVSDLNALAVLSPRRIVVTKAGLDEICQRYKAPEKADRLVEGSGSEAAGAEGGEA